MLLAFSHTHTYSTVAENQDAHKIQILIVFQIIKNVEKSPATLIILPANK